MATDPEVIRISQRFVASQCNFLDMLQDLLVSPITTHASSTLTARKLGVTPTMARKQSLCRALDYRLGVSGNCDNLGPAMGVVMPDSYSRGTAEGKVVTTPNLSMRTGLKDICGTIAGQCVDTGANLFPSAKPAQSIALLVSQLMGVAGADAPAYTAILQKHFDDARASGASATAAMKSAFTVACLSPKVLMIGE